MDRGTRNKRKRWDCAVHWKRGNRATHRTTTTGALEQKPSSCTWTCACTWHMFACVSAAVCYAALRVTARTVRAHVRVCESPEAMDARAGVSACASASGPRDLVCACASFSARGERVVACLMCTQLHICRQKLLQLREEDGGRWWLSGESSCAVCTPLLAHCTRVTGA